MLEFLSLIVICILFVYIVERRFRHSISKDNPSPFDERLLTKMKFFARLCRNKGWCSNLILTCGTIFSLSYFSIVMMFPSDINGLLAAFALLVQFFTVAIAASFDGSTWINVLRSWVRTWSDKLWVRIFKRLVFESVSMVALVAPFLTIMILLLFAYADGTSSLVRVRMIFYFLPIFFVIWVYRFRDYNDFNQNIRRLIVYTLVAILYLISKDPLNQFADSVTKPQNIFEFGKVFNEFTVIAFLTLDRIGKVIIELLSKVPKETKEQSNQ